jgi:small subunit ribosomal protein S6
MRKYEIMFIVKTAMETEGANKLYETYKNLIIEGKGTIENSKELGQKKLAYEINKETNGFYFVVDFTANTETINELDRRLGLDENIIRHLIIRLDEE